MARKEIPYATRMALRDRYRAGSRIAHLSNEFGIPAYDINRMMTEQDREEHEKHKAPYKKQDTSTRKHKYGLDTHYFDAIDTEQKAYFFGLLCADGNVYPPANVCTISLQDQDVCVLEKLREALKSTRPLHFDPRAQPHYHDAYVLSIGCKHMIEALISHGCVPRKSAHLEFPNVRPDLVRHFVRGYFDGNGSLVIYQQKDHNVPSYSWQISSTNAFNSRLADILKDECGVTSYLEDINGVNGSIHVNGRLQVARVCAWMYEGATVWLPRKRAKYEEMMAGAALQAGEEAALA